MASQFHPEFKSRPERPHPLFDGFVAASIAVADGREPELRARPESAAPVPVPAPEPPRHGRCRRVRPRRLTSPIRPPLVARAVGGFGWSIGGGAALGAAAWLSDQLGYPLGLLLPANAIGVWLAVAFALGGSARTIPTGALRGLIGLLSAVAAYYLLFATLGEGFRAHRAPRTPPRSGASWPSSPARSWVAAGAVWRYGTGWPPRHRRRACSPRP